MKRAIKSGVSPRRTADLTRDPREIETADEGVVVGRHPVLEALRKGQAINRVWVQTGAHEGSVREIVGLAQAQQIPVAYVPRERLEMLAGFLPHQGVAASLSPKPLLTLDALPDLMGDRTDVVVLLLDHIQDPQNLGAIIRVADAAGVTAVLIGERGGSGMTAAVAKASAGAVEYVPVIRLGNFVQAMETLKSWGFFMFAASPEAGHLYTQVNWNGRIGLVIGAEGEGVRPLVKAHCDDLVKLPMSGHVASLNAATAAAVLTFEIVRSRSEQKPRGQ